MTPTEEAIEAFNQKDYQKVIAITNNMLVADRTNGEAFNLMGAACQMLRRYDNAIGLFERALKLMPDDPRVCSNLAAVFCDVDRMDESVLYANKALEHSPNNISFILNRARTALKMNDDEIGRELILGALKIDPQHREAHIALGYSLLTGGEIEAGWREIDKWQPVDLIDKYGSDIFPFPKWNGMRMLDDILLVICDQGYGDAIQYSRYLEEARKRSGSVVVLGPPELRLLEKVRGVSRYIERLDEIPLGTAMFCYMSTLPALGLKETHNPYIKTFGGPVPGVRPHIGLVWRGRAVPEGRSMCLDDLEVTFRADVKLQRATFVCLQNDVTDHEKALFPDMQFPELKTFEDTARVISTLNSVVGIDTAVTHLAGAMGVPVYLLLMRARDWRYGTDMSPGAVCPIYPRTRMFRQRVQGDWEAPLNLLRQWI